MCDEETEERMESLYAELRASGYSWREALRKVVSAVREAEPLTCDEHPDRKAIAWRAWCRECYRQEKRLGRH